MDKRSRANALQLDVENRLQSVSEAVLEDAGYESHICAKGQAGKPLSAEQEANNRKRSKVRSRVEHVFGFQQNSRQVTSSSAPSLWHAPR